MRESVHDEVNQRKRARMANEGKESLEKWGSKEGEKWGARLKEQLAGAGKEGKKEKKDVEEQEEEEEEQKRDVEE